MAQLGADGKSIFCVVLFCLVRDRINRAISQSTFGLRSLAQFVDSSDATRDRDFDDGRDRQWCIQLGVKKVTEKLIPH